MGLLYVLVQISVLVGSGGTGGDVGKFYADQSRVVNVYPSQETCERAKAAVENPSSSGRGFLCIAVDKH